MKPSVGLSSILGWATFVCAEATTAVTAATGSQQDLEGPGKWVAILGIVSLVVTNAGRYLQAHALIRTGSTPATVLEDGSAALAALVGESQKAAQALPPDGVDSASVPFSGAPDPPVAPSTPPPA